MKIDISKIIEFLGDKLIRVYGPIDNAFIDNLADSEHVCEHTLDWVNPIKKNKQELAERSKAKCLLVDDNVDYTTTMKNQCKILLVVKAPKRSLAEIGNHFFVKRPPSEIHSTAIIDHEAKIGKDVSIGAYSVIGKAVIGDGCIIECNVRVYDETILGEGCKVKAGAILGGEGFGFELDESGNHFRFPQIGRLVIGKDVEIGANTCIDRGALSDTVIGDHTKINNLCHIAHNNKIGNNVVIAGCVNVSGSCVIEDNVWISPNVSLRGFNHLGLACMVGTGAVVTKDIPKGETWVGNPAHRIK